MNKLPLVLSRYFLKIFMRDRQAIFFSLFFPIIFMTVFGFINDNEPDPINLGIVPADEQSYSENVVESLSANPMMNVSVDSEESLRNALIEGEQSLVIIMPDTPPDLSSTRNLRVLVDASQIQQLGLILPSLEQALIGVEREMRGTDPMFSLDIEDVKARSQRYTDFLIPGLLAFTLMQICIAGSGFNIVEYRRKGILKRLFVTPIHPRDFIFGIVTARGIFCLVQLTVLLLVAVFMLDLLIVGNLLTLYLVMTIGIGIFLSLGFCVGSLAKTQQTVMAIGNIVVFPQIFLSGVFYPIDMLPGLIQPVASLLPLSFLVSGLREIINNGLALSGIIPDLLGLLVWGVISFILAVRLFVWKDIAH